ncbi:hypothetical protein D3C72_1884410 [compost metagenome]
MEVPPLTLISGSEPGEPSPNVTCTPAILPWIASAALFTGISANCSPFTDAIELVMSFLETVVYPTNTTSSIAFSF